MNRAFTLIIISTTALGATSGAIIGLNYACRVIAIENFYRRKGLMTSLTILLTSIIKHTLQYGLIGLLWPITVPITIYQRIQN